MTWTARASRRSSPTSPATGSTRCGRGSTARGGTSRRSPTCRWPCGPIWPSACPSALAEVARRVGDARRDREVGLGGRRRPPGRDRPAPLPEAEHGLCEHPGGLRDGLRLLRHRPGRVRPPPQRRRDRRAGRHGPARGGRATSVQHRVHGDGRATGQLRRHLGRRRAPPRRPRHRGPRPHRVDGRHRARHPAPGRGSAPGQPRGVVARGQRHAPGRAGARSTGGTHWPSWRRRVPSGARSRAGGSASSGR